MRNPLSVPTSPDYELWLELAEEAQRYSRLLAQLSDSQTELDSERRQTLEDELVDSLDHIKVHSHVLSESVTDALDLADQLEERELLRST